MDESNVVLGLVGVAVTENDRGTDTAPGSRDPATERAFARLWREYYRRLWAFVRSYAGVSSEEAEDAVQEIMLKVYRALPGLDRTRPSAPWIFRIARNHCIDGMRSRAIGVVHVRDSVATEQLADSAPGPLDALVRSGEQDAVRGFMDSAGATDRQILYLAYHERLRMREIAAALEIPVGTVKYRIHELKRMLREHLEEEA
jgi:RNA polymerase sigma-70 factor (ECF subfamily)